MAASEETYFVFADTSNVVCWHNLHFTKLIVSSGYTAAAEFSEFREAYLAGTADYLPFIPNPSRSGGFVSLFTVNATAHYTVEYDAEVTRRNEFPRAPSRLSAIYAFGRLEDCRKAHELYGWDLSLVRRFTLVRDPLTRVHRANMEIISLMRSVYPRASWSQEEKAHIWRHYWHGGGSLQVEVPIMHDGRPTRASFESGE